MLWRQNEHVERYKICRLYKECYLCSVKEKYLSLNMALLFFKVFSAMVYALLHTACSIFVIAFKVQNLV